ncbi:hypothetical protein PtA15_14A144 [Puccinia triticina]|uniref:Uncharacterized protein n=2 Tax=Puccinia triticina TaxID=208348 RepID=A0ABY7D4R8_9BASI|nr:uncharacterized protein PtA15_14A144 [Puccinia triticina]WAQ91262.1 hypothetical protein PtA15_14A144 [Puccinia triticina]
MPGSQLKLIQDTQSELASTLNEFYETTEEICDDSSSLSQTDDAELEEIKSYRLYAMDSFLTLDVQMMVCDLLERSSNLIKQLELTTNTPDEPIDVALARSNVIECKVYLHEEIHSTIRIINGSDFDHIRARWPAMVPRIDDTELDFLGIIYRAEQIPTICKYHASTAPESKVARALSPVIRLSRMFFNKLSEQPLNSKRLQKFSHLSSAQLASLGEIPVTFHRVFEEMLDLLANSCYAEEGVTTRESTQLVDELTRSFKSSLPIVEYFIAQLPEDTAGSSNQDYYKTWFNTLPRLPLPWYPKTYVRWGSAFA